jgi:hypothetical protein
MPGSVPGMFVLALSPHLTSKLLTACGEPIMG